MKKTAVILIFAILMSLLAMPSLAVDESEVEAYLPGFAVTLNGQSYDSAHKTYPVLVYQGITYLPLTWEVGRTLGVKVLPNQYYNRHTGETESRVHIAHDTMYAVPFSTEDVTNRMTSVRATIPHLDMYLETWVVRDKRIDEAYPFLFYNGIYYMPLASDILSIFDWDYSYSNESGVTVDTSNSIRPILDDHALVTHPSDSVSGAYSVSYVLGRHSYFCYPYFSHYGQACYFSYRNSETEERRYEPGDMQFLEGFSPAYYNAQVPPGSGTPNRLDTTPVCYNGILAIPAVLGNNRNALLIIDLNQGKCIDAQYLPFADGSYPDA